MFKPVYTEVAGRIEADIRADQWQQKLPGVGVLATRYSVAPKTISKAVRVLADRGLVTIHGTRGTYVTRTRRGRPTYKALGVVGLTPRMTPTSSLAEAERFAERLGYHLLMLGLPSDMGQQFDHLHRMPVDGLIFTNSTLTSKIVVNLRREGLPFVSLNRIDDIPGVPWVDYDNERGLELGLNHLAEQGHRRIAFIGHRYLLDEHQRRMHEAYRRLMTELSGYDPQLWVAQSTYMDYWLRFGEGSKQQYGREAGRTLLALPEPPTAAFVHDAVVAQGVGASLEAAGVHVPRDFSICTKTDDEPAAEVDPSFIYVQSSSRQRLTRAIEVLVQLTVQPDKSPVKELIPYRLAKGQSAGRVPAVRSTAVL